MRIILCLFLITVITVMAGCSLGGDQTAEQGDPGPQKKWELSQGSAVDEGSAQTRDLRAAAKRAEGSGGEFEDHPPVMDGDKIQRDIFIPEIIKGRWTAVKILVRNKQDEEKNEFKTVELGASFDLGDTGLHVSVGPFLPNFVMNEKHYSSMDNSLINPAVRLVVEQNGTVIFKGWSFAKYPTLYAFEHDTYSFQLMDFVPAEVS